MVSINGWGHTTFGRCLKALEEMIIEVSRVSVAYYCSTLEG